MMFRNLMMLSEFCRYDAGRPHAAYRSMLRESNWLLDPPFFMAKVLRKLTGILLVPGILSMKETFRGPMPGGRFRPSNGVQEDSRSGIWIFAFAFDYWAEV
jgi:hypothetical protein